ncbi:NETI motif-containing protein [Corticicoccus populi]|uniref:NETI motif-containing protein n=1 Tax=Corticicoccus populi TaxID=1812821 RepID=A0ABW5WZZ6_9STAP
MNRKKQKKQNNRTLDRTQTDRKKFSVLPDEDIPDCLERMRQEGYTPVRRKEVPVFKKDSNGMRVSHQEIIFEGRLMK